MPQRIRILKGNHNKIKIADSTFPLLKPVETVLGKSKATIDASSLLGDEYKVLQVDVEDYRILD
jgi:hypothetical protein